MTTQRDPAGLLLGRSVVRRRILELLVGQTGVRLHLREIQRRVGTSAGTARRELLLLTDAGVLQRTDEANRAYFYANADSPTVEAVRALLGGVVDSEPMVTRQPDPIGLDLARQLRERLGDVYGPRLRGVYLFGSRARGDQRPDSDVDILIVLDRVDGYGLELRRSSQAVSELSLSSGVPISRLLVSEQSWLKRDRPFLSAISDDAVQA